MNSRWPSQKPESRKPRCRLAMLCVDRRDFLQYAADSFDGDLETFVSGDNSGSLSSHGLPISSHDAAPLSRPNVSKEVLQRAREGKSP